MSDQIKQLEELQVKIDSTCELLHINEMKKEMSVLEEQMQSKGFWDDPEKAAKISQNHEELRKEIETWAGLASEVNGLIAITKELQDAPDDALETEIKEQTVAIEKKFSELEFYVLLDAKHDKANAIISFQAGSGGTEAQDWAEMLRRMILRYAESKNWKVTILDESKGGEAGIKSSTVRVEGRYAYGLTKSEHGTHRLVRISPFDAEGMRHTSFAGLEIIPEVEHEDLVIDEKDLRIDTFMSSGKGGQSVNTTYSAVRIVHEPTGITVSCQNEKSQLQNKKMAMKILQSRLLKLKEEEEEKQRLALRGEHKSAEWGNQIRSYVLHPYKMVKDIRTRYEESDPAAVLDGKIDGFVEAYLRWIKE